MRRFPSVVTWTGVNTEYDWVAVNTHAGPWLLVVVPFFGVELGFSIIAPPPKTPCCTDYSSYWCLREFDIKGAGLIFLCYINDPIILWDLLLLLSRCSCFPLVPLSPLLLLSRFPLYKSALIHMWLPPVTRHHPAWTSPSLCPPWCPSSPRSDSLFFSFSLSPFVFPPSSTFISHLVTFPAVTPPSLCHCSIVY